METSVPGYGPAPRGGTRCAREPRGEPSRGPTAWDGDEGAGRAEPLPHRGHMGGSFPISTSQSPGRSRVLPDSPQRAPGIPRIVSLRCLPPSPHISGRCAASSSLGHSSHRSPRSIPRGGSTSLRPSLPPSVRPRFPRSPAPGGGRAGHSLQRGLPPRTGFAAWLLRPPGQRRPGAPPLPRGTEGSGDGKGTGAVVVGRGEVQRGATRLKLSGGARPGSPPFPPKAVDLCGARIPRPGTPALCSILRSAPTPAVSGGGDDAVLPRSIAAGSGMRPRGQQTGGGGHKVTMPCSLPHTGVSPC